ncbi:hypothetical protein ACFQGE_01415 [Halomicroarcula sp. GCM10025817]|uniref:DUF7109 family protein n=1 Tax=Haloarcula TaxID=2237 RepID=UPI0023E8FB40|nr:hypothetical protein [Halomicroarcula sp. SYNS111]
MDPTPDELAGVVDLFGALTRAELGQACAELAFKRGDRVDADAFESSIDDAVASYHLVAVTDHGADVDAPLLVAGPTAFPTLPEGAGDLPHILDVPERALDRDAVVAAAEDRFQEDAMLAAKAEDEARAAELVDVSYDLDAWGPVAVDGIRERLDSV